MVNGERTRGTFRNICIFLLICQTACGYGVPSMNVTPNYQDGNMLLEVDINSTIDMSNCNLDCFLHSNPKKVLCSIRNGKERPELVDQQFKGRIHYGCNSRTGRWEIKVHRFGDGDAGNVTCVCKNMPEVNKTVLLNKPTSGQSTTQGTTPSPGGQKTEVVPWWGWFLVALAVITIITLIIFGVIDLQKCQQGRGQNGNYEVVALSQMENGGHTVQRSDEGSGSGSGPSPTCTE